MIRKIEHCQLDVNGIRILHYDDKTLSNLPNQDSTKSLRLIYDELEVIRMTVRRIDVHHALEAQMIQKFGEMQKNVKNLMAMSSEAQNTKKLRQVQESLISQIKSVGFKLENAEKNMNAFKDTVNLKLVEIDKTTVELKDSQDNHQSRIVSLETAMNQEIQDSLKKLHEKLSHMKEYTEHNNIIANKVPITKGVEVLSSWREKLVLNICKRAFRSWQEYDPLGKLKIARRFNRLLTFAYNSQQVRALFFRWIRKCRIVSDRIKYQKHLTNIVTMWEKFENRYQQSFRHWKRWHLFEKYHQLSMQEVKSLQPQRPPQVPASLPALQSSISGTLNTTLRPTSGISSAYQVQDSFINTSHFATIVKSLNVQNDSQGCIDFIGHQIQQLSYSINQLALDKGVSDGVLGNTQLSLEKTKNELRNEIGSRCDSLDSTFNYYKATNTAQIQRLKVDMDKISEDANIHLANHDADLRSIRDSISGLNDKMDAQTERLDRLFALHGTLLQQVNHIQEVQNKEVEKLKNLDNKVSKLEARCNQTFEEFEIDRNQLEDNCKYLDGEISSFRQKSKEVLVELGNVLDSQSRHQQDSRELQQDIMLKLDQFKSWMKQTAPLPPTPLELVSICALYEDTANDLFVKGKDYLSMPRDISYDVARCAHALAVHVASTVDHDILGHVMLGSKSLSIKTTSPDGDDEIVEVTHEDYSNLARENMLLRYFDDVQREFDKQRPDSGKIKYEARAIFVKRFIDALDLALLKLDTIVLSASSAFGRNQNSISGRPGASNQSSSCIACDRPLKMRTTSKTVSHASIQNRLLKQINSQLKESVELATMKEKDKEKETLLTPLTLETMKNSASLPILSRPQSAAPRFPQKSLVSSHSTNQIIDDSITTPAATQASIHGNNGNRGNQSPNRRPKSAAVTRHRTALVDSATNESGPNNNSQQGSPYVYKGGFRMPNPSQSPQEALVHSLVNQFHKDLTISHPHDIHEVNSPTKTVNSEKMDENVADVDAFLLSRKIIGKEEKEKL